MREIKDLGELKLIELDIMKKIHIFCEENNIEYYLAYGTLIGAIRHNGFIPWDDDIDIFMNRENYNKFIQRFESFAVKNNLSLASNKTKPHMCRAFAKVCDTRTIQYEPKYKDKDPRGVFVDIWPLDGYPKNFVHRFLHKQVVLMLFILLMASLTNIEYISKEQKLKRMLIKLCSNFDSEKILKKFERRIKKYSFDTSEYVFCIDTRTKYFKRKWFDNKILVKFEDTKFWAPSGYDEFLTTRYGKYMEYPPVEEQKPHHVIDTYWLD